MKDLLVCIAFHYSEERLKYLRQVVDNLLSYPIEIDIVIQTNSCELVHITGVNVMGYPALPHPFNLTLTHRNYMLSQINNYKNFAYFEDDILLPYSNYLNYLENFKLLYPKYIPSFIRIEQAGGQEYITDVTKRQSLSPIQIGGKQFTQLSQPYHGFWIMPQKELAESITSSFTRLHDSRETAASYPMWELQKTPLIEIENGQISKKCYSYHLPNNYAMSAESPFAKIKPENVFN